MFDLRSILTNAGIPWRDRGPNTSKTHINVCCPFCGEVRYHCGIHREQGWYHCFVCDGSGSWRKIRSVLAEEYPRITGAKLPTANTIFADKEKKPPVLSDVVSVPLDEDKDAALWRWLTNRPSEDVFYHPYRPRGHAKRKLLEGGVGKGVNKFTGYVTFDNEGETIARKYSIHTPGPKWKRSYNSLKPLYGETFCKTTEPQKGVVVEGVFDCLRFPLGQAVALCGSTRAPSKVLAILNAFEGTENIALALDRDKEGSQIQAELKMLLSEHGKKVTCFPWKEVSNEVRDVDEFAIMFGEKELHEVLELEENLEVFL